MTTVESRKRKVRFSSPIGEDDGEVEHQNEELATDDEVNRDDKDSYEVPEKKLKVDQGRKSKGKEEESQSQSSDQSQLATPKQEDDENSKNVDVNKSKSIIKKFLCPHRCVVSCL